MAEQLKPAREGDALTPADLQKTFEWLTDQATALKDEIAKARDVETIQEIGRTQEALRLQARALVTRQIDLIAGEARISAEHIDSAVKFADKVIAQIAGIKAKLKKLGSVLDFFAVVLTGRGDKIVEAAFQLKDELS